MATKNKDVLNLVVAIGGSAGALKAFELIIENLPHESNIAFIILQHMDPEQKSMLPDLLKRKTKLRVLPARNGIALDSNTVYVARPGHSLELDGSYLRTHAIENLSERRNPIDHFFESMSASFGKRAVGIIVSGTGSDGTIGLKKIKDAGGTCIVQDPLEAKFDGMPRSAIEELKADYVVPCESIGKVLHNLAEHMAQATTGIPLPRESEADQQLKKICSQLYVKTGHDFSSYKKTTVSRRIEKRLQARHLDQLEDYSALLETDDLEAQSLLKDLLISVTSFFRDPEAFAHLKNHVIPKILTQSTPDHPIRVWIPACATGEEAYTVGILLRESMREQQCERPVHIFATDIDRPALEFARAGRYSPESIKSVPAEYLERYFIKNEQHHQVTQSLREMCIFSEHNLIKDPPFSKLNLISCRNLFIYMESGLQEKIFPLFHYSLVENGFLFLGPADNIAGMGHSFQTLDKKCKIFQKINKPIKKIYSNLMKNSNLPPQSPTPYTQKMALHGERDVTKVISANLLENHAPPAVVINEKGEIVFYSGPTGKFFETPTGAPTTNIFELILKSIRPALHALVFRSVKEKAEALQAILPYESAGASFVMSLSVRPMIDLPELYLVVFKDLPMSRDESEALSVRTTPGTDYFIQQLETELKETKEHLQSTIEQVKSTNEELLSMNEELQSANEELQTSKEELQSTNEELETVNAEVTSKVEELDQANSDLQNYFTNTQVPILFLDPELKVQKFTPATSKIFRLIPSDTGRHITDVVTDLEDTDLMAEMKQVIETLQPLEKQVETKDKSRKYSMKVTPYRPSVNTIGGLVLTFSDVTEITRVQQELRSSYTQIVDIIERMGDAFFTVDSRWRITRVNESHCEVTKVTRKESIGSVLWTLYPKTADPDSKYFINYHKVMSERIPASFEDYYEPLGLWTDVDAYPMDDGGMAVFYRDTTEKNNNLRKVQAEKHKFEAIFQDSASSMALLHGPEFIFEKANPQYMALMGYRNILNKPLLEALPELRGQPFYDIMRNVFHSGKPYIAKDMVAQLVRTQGKAPQDVYFDFTYSQVLDGLGKPYGIYIHAIDVTDKYYAKQAISEAELKLKVALTSAHMGTWDLNPSTGKVRWSERTNELFGVETIDDFPLETALKQIHPLDSERVRNAIQKATDPSGNGDYKIEYRVKRKDGTYRWLAVMGQSYFLETEAGRTVDNFSGVVFDVTDKKVIEAQLLEAVQARDEFLSIASHELKTPLTSLKIQSQLRKNHALKGNQAAFSMDKILKMAKNDDRQIDRITRLIDDMLDITRINSGKLTVIPQEVNVWELVLEVTERFSDQAQMAGCELTVQNCEDGFGFMDRFRIEQVLTNLLTNALKYGAGKPVHVSTEADENFIIINVKDNGIGISEQDRQRIFGQFERAIHANEISGLGLGLYIVKEIITAHEGLISVESELGQGSTFTVKLPRIKNPPER